MPCFDEDREPKPKALANAAESLEDVLDDVVALSGRGEWAVAGAAMGAGKGDGRGTLCTLVETELLVAAGFSQCFNERGELLLWLVALSSTPFIKGRETPDQTTSNYVH